MPVVALLFFLCIFPTAGYAVVSASETAANDAASSSGTALGATIKDKYGTGSKVQTQLQNPMTGSGTSMTSVDGSTTFTANLSCPNSNKFMTVLVQGGSLGDLTYMSLNIDTNYTGTGYAYTYEIPYTKSTDPDRNIDRISGVCTNGVVSCDAGTWENCKSYKWVAEDPPLKRVTDETLGGCTCINNSCRNVGSTYAYVYSNMDKVLEAIGGGIVNAIQSTVQGATISKSGISSASDSASISYYGQSTSGCETSGTTAGSTGSSDLTQYSESGNYGAFTSSASSTFTTESSNPDSVYSSLVTLHSKTVESNKYEIISCSIKNTVSVERESFAKGSGSGKVKDLCVDHFAYARLNQNTDGSFELQVLDTGPVDITDTSGYHKNCDNPVSTQPPFSSVSPDWHLVKQIPAMTGATTLGTDSKLKYSVCIKNTEEDFIGGNDSSYGSHCQHFENPCWGNSTGEALGSSKEIALCDQGTPPNQYLSFDYSYSISLDKCSFPVTLSDGCVALQARADKKPAECSLIYEEQDGTITKTYNAADTNFTPYNTHATTSNNISNPFTDGTCSADISTSSLATDNQFWVKNRKYRCAGTGESYDFTNGVSRATSVSASISTDGTISYTDTTYDSSGTATTSSNTFSAGMTYSGGPSKTATCKEKVCKVKKEKYNTAVHTGGTTDSYLTGASKKTYEYSYKSCSTDDDVTFTCPNDTSSGETVVTACGCPEKTGAFAEVVVGLQAMRLAGKDFICTKGSASADSSGSTSATTTGAASSPAKAQRQSSRSSKKENR